MTRLHQLLLAATSLSAPALGGVLPGHHPEIRPCAPGTKMCHEDTVYRCSTLGKWVGNIQCMPPAHCFEDKHTQDAGCVDSHAELKRDAPAPTAAPSLSQDAYRMPPRKGSSNTTMAPSLTRYTDIKPGPHTGDLRCNGPVEEIFDDSTGWVEVQHCKECRTYDDGSINCAPIETLVPEPTPCNVNEFRCKGKVQEICADGYHWQPLQECLACKETGDGLVNCVPKTLPSIAPQPVCEAGRLRCSGPWLEYCNADRQWQSVERCAKCLESGTGAIDCENPPSSSSSSSPDAVQTAAPTKPAASPTVPWMAAPRAAARTPAPALPDILASTLFPKVVPKSAPDVSVAKDNPCFGGEVKCNGDRVNVCMNSHVWEDFGPCPNCTQLYNTKVNCTWDFAEQASNFNSVLSQLTAAESLPTPACEQGWQRCAHGNATIESCGPDGKWVHKASCNGKDRCVGIREGVAFCLDKKTAEYEVRNFGI